MQANLSKIDFQDRPVLVLKEISGEIIGTLGHAFNLTADFHYNDVSQIQFSYPAEVDGSPTPFYQKLCGNRDVELVGIGTFRIKSPKAGSDGIRGVIDCTCLSLECELQDKTIILAEDTYCMYNPAATTDTVCGMFEQDTGWKIGTVDSDLIGRYRTFSINDNWYNFIKSTVQEKYGCIWEFDTSTRTVNLRSVDVTPEIDPIFLSLSNLAKEITVEEKTEDIKTVLDVTGADDVDIRAVSPTGANKIYNLDYYISKGLFPERLVAGWQAWKSAYNGARVQYYNLTVQDIMNTQRLVAEQAAKAALETERKSLENILSVQVSMEQDTSEIKKQIDDKQAEIDAKQAEIDEIESAGEDLHGELVEINKSLAFEVFFPDAEDRTILKRYFIEGALNESSFVYTEVNTYSREAINKSKTTVSVELEQQFRVLDIESVDPENEASIDVSNTKVTFRGKTYYRGSGFPFSIHQTEGEETRDITGEAVSLCIELAEDNRYVMSVYAKVKTDDNLTVHANISIAGTAADFTEGDSLTFSSTDASFYYTRDTSAFQRQAVEWDLYDFGLEALTRLAYPSFTFTIDACNFFSLDEFVEFKKRIRLGQKLYVEISDEQVMTPILVGVSVDYENPNSLTLYFGDTYNSSDGAFRLKDMLSESVSMGKAVELGQFNYRNYINSGANTNLGDFIRSAIDASLNSIKSGSGQAMEWDQTGLRLRKWNDDQSAYLHQQVWLTNNTILFTDDNWNSGKMAIGAISSPDGSGTLYGIVAQYLVGNIIAGNQLVIESEARAGENPVFRIDGLGAQLHNASFDLIKASGGRIGLDPSFGITAGLTDCFSYDDNGYINGIELKDGTTVESLSEVKWDKQAGQWVNPPKANFWVDMNGDAYFNGKVHATDGYFSGTVYATEGQFDGVVKAADFLDKDGNSMLTEEGKFDADYLDLMGINVKNDAGQTVISIDQNGIKFTASKKYQYAETSDGPWHDTKTSDDRYRRESTDGGVTWSEPYQFTGEKLPEYIHETYIGETEIESPTITGGELIGGNIYGGAYYPAKNTGLRTKLELNAEAFGGNVNYPDMVFSGRAINSNEWMESFRVRYTPKATEILVHGVPILTVNDSTTNNVTWWKPPKAVFG